MVALRSTRLTRSNRRVVVEVRRARNAGKSGRSGSESGAISQSEPHAAGFIDKVKAARLNVAGETLLNHAALRRPLLEQGQALPVQPALR
jgi:hypothetical protein